MVELLVWVGETTGVPTAPAYGDVIDVKEENSIWGQREALDTFIVVKVEADLNALLSSLGPELGPKYPHVLEDGTVSFTQDVLSASTYRVDLSGVDFALVKSEDWYVPTIPENHLIKKGV